MGQRSIPQMLIHTLSATQEFQRLSRREKLYAHHMSRAAWLGARIILTQVSVESEAIFDLIIELYRSCDGEWAALVKESGVAADLLQPFLSFCAQFFSNVGNYYGSGDQLINLPVPWEWLSTFCSRTKTVQALCQNLLSLLLNSPAPNLGFPSKDAQTRYYIGDSAWSPEEIVQVSQAVDQTTIEPENTRLQKVSTSGQLHYEVLQASLGDKTARLAMTELPNGASVFLRKGDYAKDIEKIIASLTAAKGYATERQANILEETVTSLSTGDMRSYRNAQKLWIKDTGPSVETVIGFVEPYRDPMNVRAEFEGIVALVNQEETKLLAELVGKSATFIKDLPWTVGATVNDGKGDFEKGSFDAPDFTSLHTIAYCSSIIFPGINLPNYNDIRQTDGFKNVMIANQISIERVPDPSVTAFLDPSEASIFLAHRADAFYLWVVLHELFGHGTSKLLTELGEDGRSNFDLERPPESPLTGQPIVSWYKKGETWTSVFGDLATTVDECRAECVGAYLMSNNELLAMFGFTEETTITAMDLEYNMYLLLATGGLRALENYDVENQSWGQAHSRGHFAILRYLLSADDLITITLDTSRKTLIARVDRSRIASHGRPKLGEMLLKLHIYRCTADVRACRELYETLTTVEGQHLAWRDIVMANQRPKRVYVQPNTFLEGDDVRLVEYESTPEGVIRSWVERNV